MDSKRIVLDYFFTNADKPIFALKNLNPSVQNYIYTGVSRFPNVRERFIKILEEKGVLDKVAEAIQKNQSIDGIMKDVIAFTAERNSEFYFNFKHFSSAEGASAYVVSEENPIYATSFQQDFYYPLTTMELSTRYSKKFGIDRVYWDPVLMKSEFAEEIKKVISKNFEIYEKGFDPVMKVAESKQTDLKTTVSALDSLRFILPIASYVTIVLGGNTRALFEHLRNLLGSSDSFTRDYAQKCLDELKTVNPGFFEHIKADQSKIERNNNLRKIAEQLFKKEYQSPKKDVQLFYNYPLEELVLTQILYPFCTLPFQNVFDKVSSLNKSERKEILDIANFNRESRTNPIRGYETRPLVYEIESAWCMWKDLKRNRMNLRFQQDMRGKAGWVTPDLIRESPISKEYEDAQKRTSDLVERVYQKYGGLSRAVASQGCKKRFLLCMGPRQLIVLTELRTIGEGDRGYRRIASEMIDLAREKNPLLFGNIKNSYPKEKWKI